MQLVFVTKYRRGVLTGGHLGTLRGVFASVGADFGAELVELDGEADHVHLLVAYPPYVAVARLVNSLKGVSWRCSSSTSASSALRIGRANPAVNGELAA